MDKKKKPIEDEALDRVTGGNDQQDGEQSQDICTASPDSRHYYKRFGRDSTKKCICCQKPEPRDF